MDGLVKVTLMKEPKEAGGYLEKVNEDGSIGPFSNPYKSVWEALSHGYTIFEVEVLGVLYRPFNPTEKKRPPLTKGDFASFIAKYHSSGKTIESFLEGYSFAEIDDNKA